MRSLILIITSSLFLAVLCVGTIVTPEVSFSENENRYLQEKPKLSADAVLSGRFETQAENYLNDQIIGRNFWVKTMAAVESAVGIHDINGVYLSKDKTRAVKRITESEFDWERYDKNLRQVRNLKESCEKAGIAVRAMLVPTAAYIYEDALPKNAMTFDENKAFDDAEDMLGDSLIDLRGLLGAAEAQGGASLGDVSSITAAALDMKSAGLGADQGVFFRTDHHWSGYGAYLGYVGFLKAHGSTDAAKEKDEASSSLRTEIPSYEDLGMTMLSDEFYGTLYSKVLLDSLQADAVETPAAALDADCKVTIEGKTYDSVYFKEFLDKKDKYAVYFGGNYDKVDVEMKDTEAGKKGSILIIKDSFANSFVPFLMNDYSKISMIDTRYYRGDVEKLAGEYDEVLVLYGIDNFASEKISLTNALLR